MTTRTSERMLDRLKRAGLDLPEGTQLVNTFARDWQRQEGAWAWQAVGPQNIPLGIGSPFPMSFLLQRKWELVSDEREDTTTIVPAKRKRNPAPKLESASAVERRRAAFSVATSAVTRHRRHVPRPTWVYEGARVLLLDGSQVIVVQVDEANSRVWWSSSMSKASKRPAGFHVLRPAPDAP